jgi:hypothetical protein
MLRLSENFYNLIEKINYNEVVKKLLNVINKQNLLTDYNYITISDSNKFVNFVSTKKIDEIITNSNTYKVTQVRNLTHSNQNDHIFEALGYDKNVEYWYPSEDHEGTLHGEVTSEKTGKTYVLFKSSECDRYAVINKVALIKTTPNLFLCSKNKLKVGRFVTHIFEQNNIEFTPSEIEEFVNLYKSTFDILQDKFSFFEMVDGSDISYWYNRDNYEEQSGVLGNSCMSGSDSDFFRIYEENKNCKMLILKSDKGYLKDGKIKSNYITGRALIWNAKIVDNGEIRFIKFMDRVYTNNDSDIEVFTAYAREMGWWYKTSQNYYPETSITNGDEVIEFNDYVKRLEVDIENIYFDKYPFIDTFCYVKDEKTLINNYVIDKNKEICHGFRTTEGCYDTYNGKYTIDKILNYD